MVEGGDGDIGEEGDDCDGDGLSICVAPSSLAMRRSRICDTAWCV